MIPDRYSVENFSRAIRDPSRFIREFWRISNLVCSNDRIDNTNFRRPDENQVLNPNQWQKIKSGLDIQIKRFAENPLITTDTHSSLGSNINGPSVISVPEWIRDPLGKYYMYFAHHDGEFIRLAFADDLTGPWTVYQPGALHIQDTRFNRHIASPDVHINNNKKQIQLYFHGCCGPFDHSAGNMSQVTDVAVSSDGLNFEVKGKTLGNSYFCVWEYKDKIYALANDGHLYMGNHELKPFERLQMIFPQNRHFACHVDKANDLLYVLLTRRGDRPERLMYTIIPLNPPVSEWGAHPHPPKTVLWPKYDYEGADLPVKTSRNGAADGRVHAIRDPEIYTENENKFLFYTGAGESNICGAEIKNGL